MCQCCGCHDALKRCTLEELLLELCLGDLNLDRLVHLLVVSSLVVGIVLDGGGEERVDESCLSEARLSRNLPLSDSRSIADVWVFAPLW